MTEQHLDSHDVTDVVSWLQEFERSETTSVLLATFDLGTGGSGRPTALHIVREALRVAGVDKAAESAIEEALKATIERAAADGHEGLFIAGTQAQPVQSVATSGVAPRNTLSLGRPAPRFELERQLALTSTAVGVVWADRSGISWARVGGAEPAAVGRIEADTRAMQDSVGRTAQHDRGGPAGMPTGGHGKTRIERSAEEERERFAREVTEELERALADVEGLTAHGPVEFRSRLTQHLERSSLTGRVHVDERAHRTGPEGLTREAWQRSAAAQYRRATERLDEIAHGEAGDRGAQRLNEIVSAAQTGRLGTLVLDEDAESHFGTALDTRRHESAHDAAVEHLLGLARVESAAEVLFARSGSLAGQPRSVAGLLRW